MQPSRLRDRLRSSLWFVPALFGIVAVVLAFVLVRIDRGLDNSTIVGFGGGPESARSVLSTVAASTITFAGLVFSITVLALQLASGQFSPRVLRTFLRDRSSKVTLGVTIGTFTYSLVVLQSVRSEASTGGVFVPSLAVSAALLFAIVAVASFIQYIHHISQSIQASRILDAVAGETIDAIARLDDREPGAPPPSDVTWTAEVTADRDGVVVGVDERELTQLASSNECELTVVPRVGDPVVDGMPLLRSSVALDEEATERVREAIDIAPERTMQQDVAFGLRQLVDIAERALSPGINDPTTAVQGIDKIHAVLRRLAPVPLGPRWVADEEGRARLEVGEPTWDDLVSLGVDEIRRAGAGSLQVSRRLRAALADLATLTTGERGAPISQEMRLLDASDARSFPDDHDVEIAGVGDPQGMRSRSGSDRSVSPPS
jgi:uncharacterized membrane protein